MTLRTPTVIEPDFIEYDELGIDDMTIRHVKMFRMERMTDNSYWFRLYRDGQKDIVIRAFTKEGDERVWSNCEED